MRTSSTTERKSSVSARKPHPAASPRHSNATWTTLELVKKAEEYLQSKGIDSARLDAELLLAHVLSCDRLKLYLDFEKHLESSHVDAYRELIRKRAERCPAKYLIGRSEFMSLEFRVNPAAIIPRPETELLVEKAVELLRESRNAVAADLCTGCGNIAISIAKARPDVQVFACDISHEAIQLARQNASMHGVEEQVILREGDLFEAFAADALKDRLHLVVSNPPYIPSDDIDDLAPEISRFEPRSALDGGKDGLDAHRRIIPASTVYLVDGGHLLLEIGDKQANAVKNLVESAESLEYVETYQDFNGKERCILAIKNSQR